MAQVKQKTLILWGENDQIIDNKLATVSVYLGLSFIYVETKKTSLLGGNNNLKVSSYFRDYTVNCQMHCYIKYQIVDTYPMWRNLVQLAS